MVGPWGRWESIAIVCIGRLDLLFDFVQLFSSKKTSPTPFERKGQPPEGKVQALRAVNGPRNSRVRSVFRDHWETGRQIPDANFRTSRKVRTLARHVENRSKVDLDRASFCFKEERFFLIFLGYF